MIKPVEKTSFGEYNKQYDRYRKSTVYSPKKEEKGNKSFVEIFAKACKN